MKLLLDCVSLSMLQKGIACSVIYSVVPLGQGYGFTDA